MRLRTIPFIVPPADMSTLPNPPVPSDLNVRHFDCMHLDVKRLLGADLWDECTGDEIATALRLWAASWHQVPAGSLPNDDARLIKLAGMLERKKRWRGVRAGALRGFKLCQDGRLYHIVVCEMAVKANKKSRSGKRGAEVRWGSENETNTLGNNNSRDATAYSTRHGNGDGTDDSNIDGKADSKRDGKPNAEKGRKYSSPLPPSLSTAGTGSVDPHPPRPARPNSTEDHGVEDVHGRVCVHYPVAEKGQKPERLLWINAYGGFDEVGLKRDLPDISLTPADALALRDAALTGQLAVAKVSEPIAEKSSSQSTPPPREPFDPERERPAWMSRTVSA